MSSRRSSCVTVPRPSLDPQLVSRGKAIRTAVACSMMRRRIGRVPVLLVRMNIGLLMGKDLKKASSGNLFTVFGEPDIELRTTPDGHTVAELLGVDVYDPTDGEIRHPAKRPPLTGSDGLITRPHTAWAPSSETQTSSLTSVIAKSFRPDVFLRSKSPKVDPPKAITGTASDREQSK